MTELPLSALLSQALMALTHEIEAERGAPYPEGTLSVWANLLRCLDEGGVDQRQLPALTCLSKRALVTVIKRVERIGFVVVEPAPESRTKIVRLTSDGVGVRDAWPPLLRVIEDRWCERFGTDKVAAVRDSLEALVPKFELEMLHYPAQYGTADDRIAGGVDWTPVPRVDGGNVAGLPFSSLLSQALVAFALGYEQRNGALRSGANVFRLVGDKGLPVDDVPDEGVGRLTGLQHHQFLKMGPKSPTNKTKMVRLTWLGRLARDNYEPSVEAVEAEWHARYGDKTVTRLRMSLESLVSHLDPDLPHCPSMTDLWNH